MLLIKHSSMMAVTFLTPANQITRIGSWQAGYPCPRPSFTANENSYCKYVNGTEYFIIFIESKYKHKLQCLPKHDIIWPRAQAEKRTILNIHLIITFARCEVSLMKTFPFNAAKI